MTTTDNFRQFHTVALSALLLSMSASSALAQDLTVRNSAGAPAMFLDSSVVLSQGDLYLGQAGTPFADVDLRIRDPYYTSGQDDALFFNASLAVLALGSGTSTVLGEAGDIVLQNGNGTVTLNLAGSGGTVTAGASGNAGEVRVVDSTGTITGNLDGLGGSLTLGATGETGNLVIRDAANRTMLDFNAGTASLTLGNDGDEGELRIDDTTGALGINLDGQSGNVTNKLTGNGTVKAWAQISLTGDVIQCWRCNTSTANTRRLSTGVYEVDFTVSTDISARPRGAVIDTNTTSSQPGLISLSDRFGDASSVYVVTRTTSGLLADVSFTVVIY